MLVSDILHSAFCQQPPHWTRTHTEKHKICEEEEEEGGGKKEGSTLRLHVSKATKEWHKVKIPVCVCQHRDQVFKGKLSVVKVKGLWEAPFCKRNTEKKPFWKSSLFLCSSLPSPLLLRFICLSFLFAPVPLPPFLTASPVNTVRHHSIHPSVCRKSAIKWCRVRRAL